MKYCIEYLLFENQSQLDKDKVHIDMSIMLNY
jgi:hypothetical protein